MGKMILDMRFFLLSVLSGIHAAMTVHAEASVIVTDQAGTRVSRRRCLVVEFPVASHVVIGLLAVAAIAIGALVTHGAAPSVLYGAFSVEVFFPSRDVGVGLFRLVAAVAGVLAVADLASARFRLVPVGF